jgi:tRNA (cytidine56-2'-O)-methyltransferase
MITVLRIGHRPARDKRITTHICLTARAFLADKVLVDFKDSDLEATINGVTGRFGGSFSVKSGVNWRSFLKETGSVKIHLTMYGMNLNACMEKIEEAHLKNPDMVIIVGAEKVPGEIYGLADFNVSITNQPHSEVAALALFLDRLNHGSELEKTFNGKMRIIPSPTGKVVESTE